MKTILVALCFFFATGFTMEAGAQEKAVFDKSAFYKSMASGLSKAVEVELNSLSTLEFPDKDAYVGTLTMKKASFGGSPGKKLNLFKAGHKQLEAAINREKDNAEFRFLRLMIQENAPGVLGYKTDIKSDSDFVRKSYKDLDKPVQDAIAAYSKKSKVLKPEDF